MPAWQEGMPSTTWHLLRGVWWCTVPVEVCQLTSQAQTLMFTVSMLGRLSYGSLTVDIYIGKNVNKDQPVLIIKSEVWTRQKNQILTQNKDRSKYTYKTSNVIKV